MMQFLAKAGLWLRLFLWMDYERARRIRCDLREGDWEFKYLLFEEQKHSNVPFSRTLGDEQSGLMMFAIAWARSYGYSQARDFFKG
jgi:hypothetical protein